ncbi:MAG: transporter substrate-binding protein [Blastococcus sp.]|nr:transporter substrate-binding protein [Blastococcus sp.]
MPKRTRRFAAVAVAAALGLTACGGGSGSGGGSASGGNDTYKMGVAMALSGANAALGQDFVRFIQYGVDDANKQYASDNFKIEMVSEDTQATAEAGLNALNKLATVESVPAVFTAWSAVVKAMAPASEDLGVALFNIGANSPDLEGAGANLRNFFPLASVDVRAVATYMAKEKGAKKAAIIRVNNATGEGAAKVYKDAFEKAGGKVVATETIEQDAVDASSQVAKVLAAKPDTIHVQTLLGESSAVMKALQEQGAKVPITTYSGVGEAVAVRQASGDALNGVIYTTLGGAKVTDPKVKELVARFVKDQGREPAGISYDVYMYDSVFFYAEIIKKLRANGDEVNGKNILKLVDSQRDFSNLPLEGSTSFTHAGTVIKDVILKKIEDASKNPGEDPEVVTIKP